MDIAIETATAAHMDVLRRYYEEVWGERDEAFYTWRFASCPGLTTWLALPSRDDCGAIISTMEKTWRIDGQPVKCLEIFDWSSRERYRGKGLGVLVLRRVMEQGLPVFTLGGSEDTLRLLPKMKWSVLTEARVFALPLRGAYIDGWFRRRNAGVAAAARVAFDVAGRAWFHARRGGAKEISVVPVTEFSEAGITAIYDADREHSLVAAIDPLVVQWADGGWPRPGSYLRFVAQRGGRTCGFGLARVIVSSGRLTGEISEVFADSPDTEIYRRLIGEMSSALAGFGVDAIITAASSPLVQEALRRNRFVGGPSHKLLAFRTDGFPPAARPVHVMRATADHIVLPLPDPGPRRVSAAAR